MSQNLGQQLSGNLRNLTPGLFCLQRSHADLGPISELQPLSDEQSSDQQLPVPQRPLLLFLQTKVKRGKVKQQQHQKTIKAEPDALSPVSMQLRLGESPCLGRHLVVRAFTAQELESGSLELT